jgi:heme oxygenase
MSLKDLTQEQHRRAETRPFVKVLFSGHVDPKIYATYLKNQLPEIRRAPAILEDFLELWKEEYGTPKLCPVVDDYTKHIMSIKDDPKKLLAHIYVRHMGDLSGGQMIAKRIPGSAKYYQFGDNPDAIKEAIRSKLDDSLAEEAIVCFDYAARFFEEMMDVVKDHE